MATLSILPVQNCRVGSNAIVPHNHRLLLPLHSRLEVCPECDVLVKEVKQVVAFLLLETNDTTGELLIDIQSLERKVSFNLGRYFMLCGDSPSRQLRGGSER